MKTMYQYADFDLCVVIDRRCLYSIDIQATRLKYSGEVWTIVSWPKVGSHSIAH